jgi:hypothetical protein
MKVLRLDDRLPLGQGSWDPGSMDLEPMDLGPTNLEPMNPGPTDPGPTGPVPMVPMLVDLGLTDPRPAELEPMAPRRRAAEVGALEFRVPAAAALALGNRGLVDVDLDGQRAMWR